MFNKSSVFGRNDPAPRRDISSGSATDANAAPSSANRSAIKGIPTIKETSPNPASPSAGIVPLPAASTLAPETDASGRESAAADNVMGARLIVGPDVKLKGAEILDCDTLVVEGRVEATMDSRVIRIAENGSFSGKVSIDIAEIHGTFEGELTARSQLIIHSTGRVSGTIRYGKLVADEGGELCGDINVISANAVPVPKVVNGSSGSAGIMLGVVSA